MTSFLKSGLLCALLLGGPRLYAEVNLQKLEAPLRAVFDAWKAKGDAGLRTEAAARQVSLSSGRVAVRVEAADEAQAITLRKLIAKDGAKLLSRKDSSLFVTVPVSRLARLTDHAEVVAVYVERPAKLQGN